VKAKVLTAASIKRFLPKEKRWEAPDSACPGLRVVIHPSGAKTFSMRFRGVDGAHINYVLGPVDLSGIEASGAPVKGMPMSLASARMLGAELNRKRAMGINVVAEWKAVTHRRKVERQERTANAFAPLARQFIEQHAKKTRSWSTSARLLGFKPQTLEVVKGGLADRWGAKPVAEITADDIHHLVDEIHERGIPGLVRRNGGESDSVARVSHARLSKFFSWAIERRLITANPCTGVWRPDVGPARERVLSDQEMSWFWRACDQMGQPFGPLFKVLLLTGQRRDEVAGMAWAELSDDHAAWSLPGARTKNKRHHIIPLSTLVRAQIASVRPIGSTFVFTTTGASPVSGWSKVKARLDEKMLEVATKDKPDAAIQPWVTHDLRRTVATGLQKLGVRLEVTEAILNHVSGARAGIVGVYQRHQYGPEKREALERWSAHVAGIVDA
jgi:integrase